MIWKFTRMLVLYLDIVEECHEVRIEGVDCLVVSRDDVFVDEVEVHRVLDDLIVLRISVIAQYTSSTILYDYCMSPHSSKQQNI